MKRGRKSRMDETEIWKRIHWADKHYEISSFGRVKSFYSDTKGQLLKHMPIKGFETVDICVRGENKTFCVHKLTAEFFLSKTNANETIVIHRDWNKSNNNINNLQWVTSEESFERVREKEQEDVKKNGRTVTNSKLSPEDIVTLKTMLKKGIKQNVIARLFDISEMQVTRIKRNENWSHIDVPQEN